jgi:quercetin dioxygenase-like cupin family protein
MLARRLFAAAVLAGLSVFAPLASSPAQQGAPAGGVTGRELRRQTLPNAPGKQVVVVRVDFAPGAESPAHRHLPAVFAYVARGSIVSALGDEAPTTYGEGDSWYEPPGRVHGIARNTSATEPATLVAFFVADVGQTLTEPLKER